MRAFHWIQIVAAAAAICLGSRAASAQFPSAPGMVEVSTGTPAYPAGSVVPSTPPSQGPCGPGGCQAGCEAGCGDGSCGVAGCGGGCDPVWRVFGDFLYLRPRNEGVEYAVPINGPIEGNAVPLQIGETAVMNPEFAPGFRVGVDRCINECSEISMAYTYYRQENNTGPVTADDPYVLRSMVFHPSSEDAATDWSTGAAHDVTGFQYLDADYHHSLFGCDCTCLNYFVGMRYAKLDQEFDATFSDIITASALTHVNFDGVGLRFGLDGERAIEGGFYTSAKVDANFIGGEFRADYMQGNTNTPIVVDTSWREARFVTILEAEVAVGWQSCNGRFRGSIGYLLTDWLNAVKPSDYINSIQTNSYHGGNQMGNTSLVFDGLTAHAEVTW